MTKQITKKLVQKTGKDISRKKHVGLTYWRQVIELSKVQHYFEIFIIAVLFIFGAYHSVLYFGHQLVPNPDFTSFVGTGRELLTGQIPSSFKRAPVLGILQVCLSHVLGGSYPDLTAGWLLNAILHPFNAILLYLVGKRIVGKSALWLTIISIINPWVLVLLRQPIAETTLLFFVLLTFFLIFKRSNFCYLSASITTMVRYDGAALIAAAFVMDMILCKNKKERLKTFVYAATATIPLAIWMLWTVSNFQNDTELHYLKELGLGGALSDSLSRSLRTLWQSGFYPLFILRPIVSENVSRIWLGLSKLLIVGSFLFGSIYGLCRRQWKILALLIFLGLFTLVHAIHSYLIARFCTTIDWIAMLLCLYGLQSIWQLINKNQRVPKVISRSIQFILLIFILLWLIKLIPFLPKLTPISRRSVSIPYVTMAIVGVIFMAQRFIHKMRYLWHDLFISIFICLMIVSNQFVLVRVVANGQKDLEFKILADWFIANAAPGEKLLCGMENVVKLYAPEYKDSIFHLLLIQPESPEDFVKKCYEKDITYVAWDSRKGLDTSNRWYKFGGMQHIAMLIEPRSIGPYEYITSIHISKRRYINIFRLLPAPSQPSQTQ